MLPTNTLFSSFSKPPETMVVAAAAAAEEEQLRPPISVILYFHKAIRQELDWIHDAALALEEEERGSVQIQGLERLVDRSQFLRAIYEYHSQAEDEVLLPALDSRIKNIANSYSLEHMVESILFNQMSQLLCVGSEEHSSDIWKELKSCSEALRTTLCQHLFKEESQILPLLVEHFSFQEQASLVRHFLFQFPIYLMEGFFPWLAWCLSDTECKEMLSCMKDILPSDDVMQQVFLEWLREGKHFLYTETVGLKPCVQSRTSSASYGKKDGPSSVPLNDLLHWHTAIRKGVVQVAEDIKDLHCATSSASSASALQVLAERIEFLAKVWDFHSAAEDKLIFTVIDAPHLAEEHAMELQPFKGLLETVARPSKGDISVQAAEALVRSIERHFSHEETEVLPLACNSTSIEDQRRLLYEVLRTMPLVFLERVLPWIVAVVTDDDAKLMLLNIRLAAPARDKALVSLLSMWACKERLHLLDFRIGAAGKRALTYSEDDFFLQKRIRPLKQCRNDVVVGGSAGSSLVGWGRVRPRTGAGGTSTAGKSKPIDQIFQFHKAIRKDLEYLDTESSRLADCSTEFLNDFTARFYFLWGLYRAHSNAEDKVVFPALEAKETLHNVSVSYTIDHEQEQQLFQDIADVLSTYCSSRTSSPDAAEGSTSQANQLLAAQLQRMCKSIRVCLDQHIVREEVDLWPLFDTHFTVDEQEKLIERIIGSTGAEIIQAMLPWVKEVLTKEEHSTMMETWQQATRHTEFKKWLSAWWKDDAEAASSSSASTDDAKALTETPTNKESLQLLAKYLAENKHSESDDQDDSETFKPGWPEIFQLNQEQLEAAVGRVSRDSSLDPRRKAYLLQNLMTCRWMVSQQNAAAKQTEDATPSFYDEEKRIFGCKHYQRNCKLRASCCDSLFTCRLCHDEATTDHKMDRYQTKEMMCMKCLEVQPVGPNCSTPACKGYSMAAYYCSICKFFNNDSRSIYHCPFCNICRVGNGLGEDFFHCMVCNGCMHKSLESSHVCLEKCVETDCPICCESVFNAVPEVRALPCGHFMHKTCFLAYTSNNYTCPICCKTLGDMTIYFGMLDALLAAEQLPEEYRDREQSVLCNDCGLSGRARFHWLYHKCSRCGSYNTRLT